MSESLIAYLLHGVLKALEYLHRMGYVHRSAQDKIRNVKSPHADSMHLIIKGRV